MAAAEDEEEEAIGAAPSPPAFSVLHDKALAVDQVALCPKMDLAAVLMADGACPALPCPALPARCERTSRLIDPPA